MNVKKLLMAVSASTLMAVSMAGYAERDRGHDGRDGGRHEQHDRGHDYNRGHGKGNGNGHGRYDDHHRYKNRYGFSPRYVPRHGHHYYPRYYGYAYPPHYAPYNDYRGHHYRYNDYNADYLGGVLTGAAIGLSLGEARP